MVLMHLGLIDRPFVPHNLISSQESPVPLPEFQMAPKLNQGPLMESLTERYPTTTVLLHSSIKVPSIRAPHTPGSPWLERGHHGQRCPHPETLLTYLPGSPVKELPSGPPTEPLPREGRFIYRAPFIHLSKSPVDESSSRFPKTGPLWKEMSVFRAFSMYHSGSPAGEPSLQVPFTELPQRETLHP